MTGRPRVTRRLQRIARQDAKPASIQGHRLANAELHAEIGNAAEGCLDLASRRTIPDQQGRRSAPRPACTSCMRNSTSAASSSQPADRQIFQEIHGLCVRCHRALSIRAQARRPHGSRSNADRVPQGRAEGSGAGGDRAMAPCATSAVAVLAMILTPVRGPRFAAPVTSATPHPSRNLHPWLIRPAGSATDTCTPIVLTSITCNRTTALRLACKFSRTVTLWDSFIHGPRSVAQPARRGWPCTATPLAPAISSFRW